MKGQQAAGKRQKTGDGIPPLMGEGVEAFGICWGGDLFHGTAGLSSSTNRERNTLLRVAFCVLPALFSLIILSCNQPALPGAVSETGHGEGTDTDDLIRQTGDRIALLNDSLVRAEHPDPVAYLDSVARTSPDPGVQELFYKYSGIRQYLYEYRKDYDTALVYADSVLQILEEGPHSPESNLFYLHAILAKGEVLREQHLYGTAIQYFLQGWQGMDPDRTPCMASEYLERMATISYRQENYRDAIDFHTRAWQASSACTGQTEFTRFQRTYQYYQNMASHYYQLEMPERSRYYNGLALALLDEERERFADNPGHRHFMEVARSVALGHRGTIYMALGSETEAEQFWKESIRINEQPGFANEHAELTRLRLADYYVDAGRLEEAEAELVLVREWMDTHPTFDETAELRWRRVHWRWLDRMGYIGQAYTAFQHYMELKETIDERQKQLATQDLTGQIRHLEQQHEIEHLRTEGALKDLYLVSIVGFSGMVIAILLLVGYNWRRSKKNVLLLADLNKQVFNQKMQLTKSNKAITKIMNVVAHDLRNPLGGIRGLSSLILDDENLTDEQREWIGLMRDSSGHSLELIEEMMNTDFADVIEKKRKKIDKEPVEIRTYLRRCIDVLKFKAQEKDQSLHLGLEKKIPVHLNRDEMFRVINNVVGNAMKFSPDGATIFLEVDQTDETIRLSVRDQGIGIPENLKDQVFDMFTAAKRPGTNGEQPFGMGLSISRHIVEAHGGTIWFESREGYGTTFYIELPLQHPEHQPGIN